MRTNITTSIDVKSKVWYKKRKLKPNELISYAITIKDQEEEWGRTIFVHIRLLAEKIAKLSKELGQLKRKKS